MPKPYSLDLRERVVSYVEAGHCGVRRPPIVGCRPRFCHQFDDGAGPARGSWAQGARRLTATCGSTRTASSSAPGGEEGRHQHAGAGR